MNIDSDILFGILNNGTIGPCSPTPRDLTVRVMMELGRLDDIRTKIVELNETWLALDRRRRQLAADGAQLAKDYPDLVHYIQPPHGLVRVQTENGTVPIDSETMTRLCASFTDGPFMFQERRHEALADHLLSEFQQLVVGDGELQKHMVESESVRLDIETTDEAIAELREECPHWSVKDGNCVTCGIAR